MPIRPGERIPLALDFKGSRDYLHGTDMFDALIALAPGMTSLSLKIHRIAHEPVAAVRRNGREFDRSSVVAVMTGAAGGERIEIGLETSPELPAPGRYDYDEGEVTAAAGFDAAARAAAMPENGRYSFVEQAVALQKALLDRVFPDARVKWYFSRLEIARVPKGFSTMALAVSQSLGTSLVKSALEVDGAAVGDIYFSGVKL